MQAVFASLQANPFILLFLTVGLAVLFGRVSVKGYGLGMVAAAIIVGAGLATWSSLYGVRLQLDDFTKSLFYYLFMYGVGLRVGPSFINSIRGDGLKFLLLAVVCSVLGLVLSVAMAGLLGLPPGAAGGILAGSQTMSASLGTAEMAITSGAFRIPEGSSRESVTGMLAIAYGVTYIWGTVGIILVCKYLPRWWGVDARSAALAYEKEHGVPNLDDAGLSAYQVAGVRAYRLENPRTAGRSIAELRVDHPEYRVLNVVREGRRLPLEPGLRLQLDDVVALGGLTTALTAKMGLLGPEVADREALNVPLDQAEILVTNPRIVGRRLKEFAQAGFAGQAQLVSYERGGVPYPAGRETEVRKFDVMKVVGLRDAVDQLGALAGRIARPSSSTDLLTLSIGMILGLLVGLLEVEVGGFAIGLGAAGGLLLSGIFVSSVVARFKFFGNTPNPARNLIEDLGLITFVAIVGINAGSTLLEQLNGTIALRIFLAGFVASTVPPIVVWAIGHHLFRINPAVLMGGVAGARSHSGPAREAAVEVGSSVPWIGFPVGYAVSGVLLTVFGYFAMILSQ
jgi:putative transport protein